MSQKEPSVAPSKPSPLEHLESEDCWCEPELEFVGEDGTQVWVHRSVQ